MILIKMGKSLLYAANGLKTVWNEEHNFRIETAIAVVVLVASYFLHFSFLQLILLIIAITTVLTAEVVNTVVEDICNKIQPDYDLDIKKIKDAMAAFVLLTAIGAGIIGVIIFYPYVMYFISLYIL